MTTANILVIDDERGIRALCSDVLGRSGYRVVVADTATAGLAAAMSQSFDLILCDINLPDGDGVALLPTLLDRQPAPAVLLITAYPSIDTAVRGMKLGARDYVGKPFSPDELRMAVARALAEDALRRQHDELKRSLAFGTMIGNSGPIQQLRANIDRVAHSDAAVLVTGESGTGKELVARAIHFAGRRGSAPFVPINCGALVGNLLDTELFGHVRGAFTGADSNKQGLFVVADGGTLVLDEIAELPLELQPKLLRTLQEGEVRPVGATQSVVIDTRVVASTNRDLTAAIAQGTFREDLYYRLAVVTLDVPPLRLRRDDIPILVRHFADAAAQRAELARFEITDRAIAELRQRAWRGNVRELENVVERAAIMASSNLLDESDFAAPMLPSTSSSESDSAVLTTLDDLERSHIIRVLQHCSGQKSKAASILGINRTTLWKKLRLYGLEVDE
jgi:DNA-binding NtrC family response regulator